MYASRVRGFYRRYHLHGDFHPIKGVRRPVPGAGERGCLFLLAGHANGDMLGAGEFVIRGIEAAPARAGDVNLRPSVGGTVLTFAHLYVAGDKSRTKPPMPGSLHHQHRVVPAGSSTQGERLAGELDTGILAAGGFEGFVNARVQLVQEVERINELGGAAKVEKPILHDRTVVRIAGQTGGDELHLLIRIVLERVRTGTGFDETIDGIIIVKINIDLAEKTQFSRGLAEDNDGAELTIDVAQQEKVGLGFDFETRAFDMDIVSLARP